MYNYPMHEIAKTIQNLPTYAAYACAAGVGVCTIGAGAYWIARKLARSARQIAAVSLVGAVLIGGMVVVGTDDAGTKQMENGELIMDNAGGAASTLHSPFSILHLDGWRVFSVVSNNATTADVFAFSNANAVCASVWEAAQRHGAVYGHWALPLGEWLFPFGDSGWTHLFLRCEGVTFSNHHSLETLIYWNETNSLAWATNYVDLVTTYEGGYAVTNHCVFTVGTQTEPTPSLELTCPTNLFLNSTLYSNYVERVYPASVKVTAPHGARGRLWLDVDNDSGIRLYADRERTAGMPSEIVVEIPEVGDYGTNVSFFVTCPRLGMGRIQASLFLTDGTEKDAQVDVLVIEPERRLVMDEHDARTGIIVNPSRLVYGTNAVLKVGVHQSGNDFNPMDITWHPISGNCRMSPTNGLSVVVEPTTDSGVAVVEARFNDDAVQPRFVLPIVRWRELAVKAFVVQPPEDLSDKAWTIEDVNQTIAAANSVYSQIGVRFNLQEIVMEGVGTSADWNLQRSQVVTNGNRKTVVLSNQAARLFDHYKSRDCIELYFVGTIIPGEVIAFHHTNGIAISKKGVDSLAVAHEIGHALGLKDCYALNKVGVTIGKENEPVVRGMFSVAGPDWGDETSHGYYAFDDSLGKMLRSMLMCGRVDDGMFGTDIPDDWIESLEANTLSTNQATHATVGARTVESKAEAEIYSK